MVLLTWPCLIFGKLDVVLWARDMHWGIRDAIWDLLQFCGFLGVPLFLRLVAVADSPGHTKDNPSIMIRTVSVSVSLHVLAFLAVARSLLQVGGGFHAAWLLMSFGWIGYAEGLLTKHYFRRAMTAKIK
jgi:hypothetical protein